MSRPKSPPVDTGRLSAATAAFSVANDEYVAAIIELRTSGATLSAIAEAAEMTPAGVLKLLRRAGVESFPTKP